jgi:hypothetical protein
VCKNCATVSQREAGASNVVGVGAAPSGAGGAAMNSLDHYSNNAISV